ncbi:MULTISPECIES: hypothetical protein [unclassified Bartonella]|uniref:hypothetical protein n=1 Tax=unclassified Bartonella TaxID=2645622 RepID=UPI0021C63C93|nr:MULTISPECIES: hypothetical protein [unclassified Bartonella]UXM94913.1 hypothetical protein N5853_12615 [Bartonella sp. HY329]UXN05987.1 hypothetical protein N6A79_11935 [Bartonella sp. HY761]UXN09236.1 hypothetical protein N5852_12625 [Bartonella sp. HY328]
MAVYQIKILGGDFEKGKYGDFSSNELHLAPAGSKIRKTIKLEDIESIAPMTENSTGLGTAVMTGFVGVAVKGLTVGLKDTTFTCVMKDGRKLVATMPSKGYWEIHAALM